MEPAGTDAAEAAPTELIIHAQRADQLVQLARSEQRLGAERAEATVTTGGSALR